MGVAASLVDADNPEDRSLGGSGGVLMVPWISRIARPDGVWRRVGRGFEKKSLRFEDCR